MIRTIISLFFIAMVTMPAFAGFSLGQTRVIYNEKENQASLRLINRGDVDFYLIQAWIENQANKNSSNFLITPPIFKLAPDTENTLIIRSVSDTFPADRESLYYVVIKAIPATDSAVKNKISFATKNIIKLIYRPASLKASEAMNTGQKLNFKVDKGHLIITNPTAYIVNFGNFFINNNVEDLGYVLPFSEKQINLKSGQRTVAIKFNTINDYGGTSDYLKIDI